MLSVATGVWGTWGNVDKDGRDAQVKGCGFGAKIVSEVFSCTKGSRILVPNMEHLYLALYPIRMPRQTHRNMTSTRRNTFIGSTSEWIKKSSEIRFGRGFFLWFAFTRVKNFAIGSTFAVLVNVDWLDTSIPYQTIPHFYIYPDMNIEYWITKYF